MKNNPLFLGVKKVPIKDYLPKFNTSSRYSHLIIVDAPDKPIVVNACSKNYQIIRNEDIFKPLKEHLDSNFAIEERIIHRGYSKFYVDYVIKDKSFAVIPKDSVLPKIRVMNSYDGSLKFSFNFGFHRLVCSNGLSVPIQGLSSKTIKIMHTPGAIGRWDKIVELAKEFLDESKNLIQGYKDMAAIKLTFDQALEKIEYIVKHTKAPSKQKEQMVARLEEERKMGLPLSNWLVYNAVNYQLNHGEAKMMPHKVEKLDNQILKILTDI